MQKVDSVIVSVSFSDENTGVLIVGRKDIGYATKIINSFEGKEARELYEKLITPANGNKNE